MKKIPMIILLSLLLYHCGTTYYGRGWELISDKDYSGAVNYFESQMKGKSDNYNACFGLGVSYFMSNKFPEAVKYFEKAEILEPKKSETKYYLGLCMETQKDNEKAIKYYLYYSDVTIDSKYKSEMEKRYLGILKARYQAEAKDLIAREKQIQQEMGEGTLAVINFDNRSRNVKYDPLQQGFPAMFITDFSIVPRIKVVERLRLQALLDELKVNTEGVMSEATLQKAGKLLGAKNILKGGFTIDSDNNLSIDITTIDVSTGQVKEPVSKNGKLNDFYKIEKEMVINMVDRMGIAMTDDIRQRILTIPTENFFDFLGRMKKETEIEKVELPSAQNAVETSISVTASTSTVTTTRLNTIDVNTGSENASTTERSDVPSRFLPDPPLPPK
jgi:tetratricopeptide (TPR) repeat protein